MSMRITLLACCCVILGACVRAPEFKTDNYAYIRSNYPIVSLNGEQLEPVYRLDIEAGVNTVVIVYNTYRHDYYCTFSWASAAKTAYEVTDQENRYPLTLYRWVKTNSLWASRLDPTDPIDCIRKARSSAAFSQRNKVLQGLFVNQLSLDQNQTPVTFFAGAAL